MKALLLKDLCTVIRPMRYYLVLLLVFALVPRFHLYGLPVTYMAALAVSSLSYDERSHWDSLAAMMPYTAAQLVGSKYILAALSSVCAAALAVLGAALFAPDQLWETVAAVVACVAVGLLLVSLALPIMYRIGTERGRLPLMAFTILIACCGTLFSIQLFPDQAVSSGSFAGTLTAVLAGSLALFSLSFLLSTRIYQRKK
ncbi:MAG: ABC-2 transporter permease [Oscillospiraceae bacterium]